MGLPTPNHIFYIPLVLAVGAVLGYWWGRRSLRIHLAEQERLQRRQRLQSGTVHTQSRDAEPDVLPTETKIEE